MTKLACTDCGSPIHSYRRPQARRKLRCDECVKISKWLLLYDPTDIFTTGVYWVPGEFDEMCELALWPQDSVWLYRNETFKVNGDNPQVPEQISTEQARGLMGQIGVFRARAFGAKI